MILILLYKIKGVSGKNLYVDKGCQDTFSQTDIVNLMVKYYWNAEIVLVRVILLAKLVIE